MSLLLPGNAAAGERDGCSLSGLNLSHTRVRLHYYLHDVRVEIVGRKSVPPDRQPPDREACGEWSRHSRQRLLWVVNNCGIEWATLLSITYPETWPCIGRVSQVHLANLIRSIKKRFPGVEYLWVREYQKRGATHFHILLTCFGHGLPDMRYRHATLGKGKGPYGWKELHKWVSRRWQETIKGYGSLAGIRAGCRWEILNDAGGGAKYISTYAGKKEQKVVPDSIVLPGRWWGHSQSVAVPDGVPFAEISLADYLRNVQGPAVSDDGWLFGVLHNGRERAHLWIPPTGPDNPTLRRMAGVWSGPQAPGLSRWVDPREKSEGLADCD